MAPHDPDHTPPESPLVRCPRCQGQEYLACGVCLGARVISREAERLWRAANDTEPST